MKLDTGELSIEQINALLLALPLDLTFTDENDLIRYFNGKNDLIFSREPEILGTDVIDCHSPRTHPDVNHLLTDLKSGARDFFEAWKENDRGRFIHTRYIAVRDKNGTYLGCLETVQDVTEIRALSGSKKSME